MSDTINTLAQRMREAECRGEYAKAADLFRQIQAIRHQVVPRMDDRKPFSQQWRKCYICGEPVPWQTNGIGWHPIQYHDCKPVPGARLEQAERERDELRAEVERLREFENEMTALWKNVMDEKCGTDEVHCSCVPALRHLVSSEKARADKATAERDQLRADVEREKTRADKMKADGERAVMEERNQTAKATAERDRLAGMLARLRHQVGKIMPPRTDCDCSDCLFMRSIDAALAEVGK